MKEWFIREVLRRRVRGFEVVDDCYRRVPNVPVRLPERSTDQSAGYDVFALTAGTIMPGQKMEFPTDIKIYMPGNEVAKLFPRSNQGIKHDVMLANTTGIIDADFYGNMDNDGGFTVVLRNLGEHPYPVNIGDKLAQIVFTPYYKADHDYNKKLPKRQSGIGSTGR